MWMAAIVAGFWVIVFGMVGLIYVAPLIAGAIVFVAVSVVAWIVGSDLPEQFRTRATRRDGT